MIDIRHGALGPLLSQCLVVQNIHLEPCFSLAPYVTESTSRKNVPVSVLPSPILLLPLLPDCIEPRIPSIYPAPLHFWCVSTSQPNSFSLACTRFTYASMPWSLKARESSHVIVAVEWRPASEINWRTNLNSCTSELVPFEVPMLLRNDVWEEWWCVTYPCFARSHTKFFNDSSEKPWPIQLKLGLRLYTNFFPGCSFLISPAKPAAFSTFGSAVSTHSRSA
jgi:hypothetical protein